MKSIKLNPVFVAYVLIVLTLIAYSWINYGTPDFFLTH